MIFLTIGADMTSSFATKCVKVTSKSHQSHIKVISKSCFDRWTLSAGYNIFLSSVVHLVSLAVFGEDGVFEYGLGFADDNLYLIAFVAGGEVG